MLVSLLIKESLMPSSVPNPASSYGVRSEVGKLRKVLVCAPGLAYERLTPTNRKEQIGRAHV